MAKKRLVNTRFWSDSFVVELNPLERYLFLYLWTNEHTDMCGIYELPWRVMARETGLDDDMLQKMFKRLAGKVFYVDGWIYVKNFAKHQSLNESIKIGIKRSLETVPDEIKAKIKEIDTACTQTGGRVITDCGIPKPKPKPKLELKPYSDTVAENESTKQINIIIDKFQKVNPSFSRLFANKTQRDSVARLLARNGFEALVEIVDVLDRLIVLPYCPKVTTPFELERDWGKLAAFEAQQKSLHTKNSVGII